MMDDKPEKEPKASAQTKSEKLEEAIYRGITEFVNAHLRDSDFSRDTPAWNHFRQGIPLLTKFIAKQLEG